MIHTVPATFCLLVFSFLQSTEARELIGLDNYESPTSTLCAFPQYYMRTVCRSMQESISYCDRTSNCSGIQFFGEAAPEPEYYVPIAEGCPVFMPAPSYAPSMHFFKKKPVNESQVVEEFMADDENATESSPPQSDLPDFSGIFEMIQPPLEVEEYPGSDYERWNETRCVGGYQIAAAFSVDACSNFCDEAIDCGGFIVDQWGPCIAMSIGCAEIADTTATYYKKQSYPIVDEVIEQIEPVQAAPGGLADTPLDEPDRLPSFSDYEQIDGKRCTGGSKIGDIANSLDTCKTFCSESSNCAGINFIKETGSCVARTFSCTLRADKTASFYKKGATSEPAAGQPQEEMEIPPPLTEISLPSFASFEPLNRTRCAGGSKIVDSDLAEVCLVLCMQAANCSGFNYDTFTGACAARTDDCVLTDSSNSSVFFRKSQDKPLPTTTKRPTQPPNASTQRATKPAATTLAPEKASTASTERATQPAPISLVPEKDESLAWLFGPPPNYTVKVGISCVGNSSVIGSSGDLGSCIELCSAISKCAGFDYSTRCTMQTADCVEKPTQGAFYYKKN